MEEASLVGLMSFSLSTARSSATSLTAHSLTQAMIACSTRS